MAKEEKFYRDGRQLEVGHSWTLLAEISGSERDFPSITRTALLDAASGVLDDLTQYWVRRHDDRTHQAFIDRIWHPICKLAVPAETYEEPVETLLKLGNIHARCDFDPDGTLLLHGVLCCAHSMRALASNDVEGAMNDLLLASSYLGAIEGANLQRIANESDTGNSVALSLLGSIGALARHRENRALKADALRYYVAHQQKFKSKDEAAEAIARKVVPVSFRTVREWLKASPKAGPETS